MRNKIVILSVAILAMVFAGAALAQPEKSFADADFVAELSGANEFPNPVDTATTGEARFTRDGDTLRFELEIEDGVDIMAVAGAHIHCAPAGANGPIGAFLAGAVPPNGFDGDVEVKASLNDDSFTGDCPFDNIDELIDAFDASTAYVNVHSAANPGGEIRGQIERTG